MDLERLEQQLAQLPLAQYALIDTQELTFSERIRYVCEHECPRFGTSWSCPPAVGTPEECRARCLSYPRALLLTTLAEAPDVTDMAATLATRAPHEEITRQAAAFVREQAQDVLVLSAESCHACERCTYPDGPCRRPELLRPCVESHCIVTTDIAEKYGIEFYNGSLITWFSVVLFR